MDVGQQEKTLLLWGGDVLSWDGASWEVKRKNVFIRGDRIVSFPDQEDRSEADESIDCRGKIVFPGLHNCHSHLLELWQRSMRESLPLEPWVPYKAALDVAVHLQADEVESIVRLACLELLRNGVTSVVDHMFQRPMLTADSIEAALRALKTSGIRGWLSPSLVDLSPAEMHAKQTDEIPEDFRAALTGRPVLPIAEQLSLTEHAISIVKRIGDSRLNIIVGPGAPTFCSESLFEQAVDLASRKNLLLHTHLLETRGQRLVSAKRFDQGSAVSYLDRIGALTPRFFAAHVIWIHRMEIELLAERGVSVVHNPCSNLRTGSGLCPVLDLRDAGINIAFGSDGGDSSDGYSILDQAKTAAIVHRLSDANPDRWITGEAAFTMATIGGASILTGGDSGNIEVGQLADLVVMDRDYRYLPPGPIARQLVHVGKGNIRHVVVDGKIVIRDGASPLFNEAEDVEVLKRVIARGEAVLGKSVSEANVLAPYLRGIYDQSVIELGSFRPGDVV